MSKERYILMGRTYKDGGERAKEYVFLNIDNTEVVRVPNVHAEKLAFSKRVNLVSGEYVVKTKTFKCDTSKLPKFDMEGNLIDNAGVLVVANKGYDDYLILSFDEGKAGEFHRVDEDTLCAVPEICRLNFKVFTDEVTSIRCVEIPVV